MKLSIIYRNKITSREVERTIVVSETLNSAEMTSLGREKGLNGDLIEVNDVKVETTILKSANFLGFGLQTMIKLTKGNYTFEVKRDKKTQVILLMLKYISYLVLIQPHQDWQ